MHLSAARRQAEAAKSPRWRIGLALLAIAAVIYLFVGGDEGLLEIRRQSRRLEGLQARIARLEAENDSLRQVLRMLERDLEYVEKVAREEYGMIKPGERVYRLREK